MITEQRFLIGMETMWEKTSVRSSWLKYQELRIIMFKQQALDHAGIDVGNHRCLPGKTRYVRSVLEKTDDKVVDGVWNI